MVDNTNKGAIFSRHRLGDKQRLNNYLGRGRRSSGDKRLTVALGTLPPGHMIPVHPLAYQRFLNQAS